MRLRYLRIRGMPPLTDVSLHFKEEMMLRRAYGSHFVVGVNGSGKTRLLRTLAEIFLHLRDHHKSPFPFPVTLAYEIGRREMPGAEAENEWLCYLHYDGGSKSQAWLALFDLARLTEGLHRKRVDDGGPLRPDAAVHALDSVEWDDVPEFMKSDPLWGRPTLKDRYPIREMGSGSDLERVLPRALVVYTSGAAGTWNALFDRNDLSGEALGSAFDPDEERPVGWDGGREREYVREVTGEVLSVPTTDALTDSLGNDQQEPASYSAVFLTSERVDIAAWALLLDKVRPRSGRSRASTFQRLLDRVGWESTVSLGLRLNLSSTTLEGLPSGERAVMHRLYRVASIVRRDPEPGGGRLLVFDLQRPVQIELDDALNQGVGDPFVLGTTGEAVYWAFSGEAPTAFGVFKVLHRWQATGVLVSSTITLKKRGTDGLMAFDQLSDGERMYVGRMAVLHLLQDENDALIILDEPETHFNDAWKREIVDVIADAMRDNVNEVVISTHSSIALTDAFDTEIVLLEKNTGSGSTDVVRTPIPTFGASPNEIMRYLFDAPHTAGVQATQLLDLLLFLAGQAALAEQYWRCTDARDPEGENAILDRLQRGMRDITHDGTATERRNALRHLLESLHEYARQVKGTDSVQLVDALREVQARLGSGYYQLELLRRIRSLSSGIENASPN